MQTESPSMLKPALLGGAIFGIASALPFIGAVNCACCALIIGSGFLAAYFHSQECKSAGAEFLPGTGALVGLLAGLVHALVAWVVNSVFMATQGLDFEEMAYELEQQPWADPETTDIIVRFVEGAGVVVLILLALAFWLVVSLIFATIGGLIGGAVFKVERPLGGGGPPSSTPPSSPLPQEPRPPAPGPPSTPPPPPSS